jgi:hypothetical protein
MLILTGRIVMKRLIIILIFLCPALISSEESLWETVFNNYINDNYDNYVLYSDAVLLDDSNTTEKAVYLMNVYNVGGIIFIINDNRVINCYEFFVNTPREYFALGDVHGGIWSINKARNILDNIYNMQFKFLKGKDIKKEIGLIQETQGG